ncbi:MAG: tRNA uridine-5-carboxymethylaminomethyl(34) synthesis GTPase MnmE [Clostridia bacterium]|nr:tRNA uridine-5-carboxymethylaminomethyl(34) synthesis GTPase MnmE [Clostridia bacterium]
MNTIAAISTPIGHGGIGIVRMSGEKSLDIVKKIFKSKHTDFEPNTIVYGKIYDNDELIDEVLVSYFKAPNSYTGEDIVEVNTHGGMLVVERILELLLKNGAVLAEAGEFTKRAFLNGKIDLSQAEAVVDLINSKTKAENKTSIKQLEGDLGNKIRNIKTSIIDVLVDLEANVDYPEYDIEEISREKVTKSIEKAVNELCYLSDSYEEGKIIKEGINIAIVGKPNVGKSSLLNRLLKEERAIVTNVAGTTRDTIEESIIHKGVVLNIIDTAGIHETADLVENIGVEKSKQAIDNADLVLLLIDNSSQITKDDIDLLTSLENKTKFVLINKSDVNETINEMLYKYTNNDEMMLISAKENKGITELLDKIVDKYVKSEIDMSNSLVITNKRHKEAIDKTIDAFNNVLSSCKKGVPLDMLSIDIQNGISFLGEILGDNVSEDIINGIFAKFCLGK